MSNFKVCPGRSTKRLVLALSLLSPVLAIAGPHKCKMPDGTSVYQDRPCEADKKAAEFNPPPVQSTSGAQLNEYGWVGRPGAKIGNSQNAKAQTTLPDTNSPKDPKFAAFELWASKTLRSVRFRYQDGEVWLALDDKSYRGIKSAEIAKKYLNLVPSDDSILVKIFIRDNVVESEQLSRRDLEAEELQLAEQKRRSEEESERESKAYTECRVLLSQKANELIGQRYEEAVGRVCSRMEERANRTVTAGRTRVQHVINASWTFYVYEDNGVITTIQRR